MGNWNPGVGNAARYVNSTAKARLGSGRVLPGNEWQPTLKVPRPRAGGMSQMRF